MPHDSTTEVSGEGESVGVEEWSEDEKEQQERELIAQRSPERVPLNIDWFWDTDRARRALYRETESRIGVKISVSTWRQVYPAIQREFTRNKSVRETLDSIYEQQQPQGSGVSGEGQEGGRVSANYNHKLQPQITTTNYDYKSQLQITTTSLSPLFRSDPSLVSI